MRNWRQNHWSWATSLSLMLMWLKKPPCYGVLLITIWRWTSYSRASFWKWTFFFSKFFIGWQIIVSICADSMLAFKQSLPTRPSLLMVVSLFWSMRFRLIPSPAPYVLLFFFGGERGKDLKMLVFFSLLSIINGQSWVVGESWHITFLSLELCFMCENITNFVHLRL